MDGDSGLVVAVGGEGLGVFGGDGRVPFDERGHDSAGSLDTKRQGSNIQEEEVANLEYTL